MRECGAFLRNGDDMMRQTVAILGAGVIGLLTARLLLQRGVRVQLLDRQAPARGASWAGGGIVSPLYPWRYSQAVTTLAAGAQEAHASLAAALRADTGIDPQYNPCGLLMLAPRQLDDAIYWCRRNHRRVVRCDAAALQVLQPGLSPSAGALWMPEIGNVRNPRLLQALLAYVSAHPHARVRPHTDIRLVAGDGGAHLFADGEKIDSDAIVVAAGAWSAELLKPFGISLPVIPVRGQMLQFAPMPGLLRRIVLHDGRYLIPRRDGRILAGSTLEYAGFDAATTGAAHDSLLASAVAMLPALQAAAVERQWAGLRPGSPSGIPFIDRVPGTQVFVNAGHFRNGLVLAPAAAALGVALVMADASAIDPAPYALDAPRGTTFI